MKRRLSPEEKKERKIQTELIDEMAARARFQLQHPQRPAELQAYVRALMDVFGCNDLFNRSSLKFVREAHVAAALGIIRKATFASLIDADRPDFELHFEHGTEIYELAEA